MVILLVSFPLLYGNDPILVWREIGMGYSHMSGEATNMGIKNSSWVTNGTFPFSPRMAWHAWGKKIPPRGAQPQVGEFFSPHKCQAMSGENGNVPWVTNEEFYSSLILSRPGFTFPYGKENLDLSFVINSWNFDTYLDPEHVLIVEISLFLF